MHVSKHQMFTVKATYRVEKKTTTKLPNVPNVKLSKLKNANFGNSNFQNLQQIQHVMCHTHLIFYANNTCCCDLSDTCQATKTLEKKNNEKNPLAFF